MKKLSTIQKRENLNDVYAIDNVGTGSAHHQYKIAKCEDFCTCTGHVETVAEIQFQSGARNDENSTIGVLDADLLEIVRDRLKGFQKGEFATRENAYALTHIEEALMWLNQRVEDRFERNVLGTYEK